MKKKFVSLLLALVVCLGLLPVGAAAAETKLPDWYFLFAICKNVDADGKDKNGKAVHVTHSMTQDEVDIARSNAKDFEEYMNSVGVMRTHVEVVEIDEAVTELKEYSGGSYVGSEQATPLLKNKVNLDRYDHVFCIASLDNLATSWVGVTGSAFENGTGHSCINFKDHENALKNYAPADGRWRASLYVHEFLHFMERMNKKWGGVFILHRDGKTRYTSADEWKSAYTDAILNRIDELDLFPEGGTGIHPAAWQYPPHVLRTMTELTVPSGVTGIGVWAFGNCTNLNRVFIPTSVKSIEYAAFWDTGVKDVYYAGTKAQWKAIQMGEYNEKLTRANIHYNHLMADVKTDDWFAKGVIWAVENGVTAGTGDGGFSPNATCTQAQILTFLWRAYGSPESAGKVSGSEYYAVPLQWAKEQGFISGSLDPNSPCTRADVVTYLWKLAGSPTAEAASFSDVPASASYAGAVNWAVKQGITSGTSATTFGPNSACTRGQIVTFLHAALGR